MKTSVKRRAKNCIRGTVLLACFIAVWYVASCFTQPLFIPAPATVWEAIVGLAETGQLQKGLAYSTVSSRNVKDDVTGAWHKEPFYKTEDRLPLGHGEKSVIILQSFIKLTRDEIVAIRWHMGSFDCAVKGGDYGMGNAFETYPLAVMTHLADMEATYLVEGLATK